MARIASGESGVPGEDDSGNHAVFHIALLAPLFTVCDETRSPVSCRLVETRDSPGEEIEDQPVEFLTQSSPSFPTRQNLDSALNFEDSNGGRPYGNSRLTIQPLSDDWIGGQLHQFRDDIRVKNDHRRQRLAVL